MAIDKTLVQPLPVISAIINSDDTAVLTIDSTEEAHTGATANELRQSLMAEVFAEAAKRGRPVRVSTMDESGLSTLLCSPSGEVEIEDESPAETASPVQLPALNVNDVPTPLTAPRPAVARAQNSTPPAAHDPVQQAPSGRRALREAGSFLATQTAHEPATQGVRGAMNALGFSIGPSAVELAERVDIAHVSKHFTGTRTVAFVNQKGGSVKTPSVACMAAIFGRAGASVLAWDNNETTGTLGWRTEQGDHTRSALDVLAHSEDLLSLTAHQADINAFVHHQGADKFDVLRSDEDIEGTHQVSAKEVDTLHRIAAKYYRLILMDSGNNHRAENWNRMIEHTDQLVVPTTTMEDRAHAGLLTLQGLDRRDERSAALARNAVVVVSQWQPKHESIAARIADDFRPFVREVVVVPFDAALVAGQIRFDALQAATRRAWLCAAASVASGL